MSKTRAQAIPTVQAENDRVIVTEWRFAPGAGDRLAYTWI